MPSLEEQLRHHRFPEHDRFILGFLVQHKDGAVEFSYWAGASMDEVVARHRYIYQNIICEKYPSYLVYDREKREIIGKECGEAK
jgi:hypothetical protein